MKKGTIGVLSTIIGATAGAGVVGMKMNKALDEKQSMSNKHFALFKMMNQWVRVKQEGKNLSDYFEKNGYKNIAIYGMSFAGETLVYELENTSTNVSYGIDRNAKSLYLDVDIVEPDGELEEVDAVVVTAITFFDEIEEMLSAKVDCPIISLEDILYEV